MVDKLKVNEEYEVKINGSYLNGQIVKIYKIEDGDGFFEYDNKKWRLGFEYFIPIKKDKKVIEYIMGENEENEKDENILVSGELQNE